MPAPPISIQPPFQLMSTSTLGSVNGKNEGRKRMWTSSAKAAAGKQPQRALQVGHRHAAIDQQAFDLVEHRIVRGVGGVGPIDPAAGDDPHRRRVFSITRICTVLVWLRSRKGSGVGAGVGDEDQGALRNARLIPGPAPDL